MPLTSGIAYMITLNSHNHSKTDKDTIHRAMHRIAINKCPICKEPTK